MTDFELIQIITGTVGTLCFSVLFNVRGRRLLFATLAGLISWSIYLLFNHLTHSEVLSCFISAALITVYCEVMARVIKTPTSTFIVPSLIPLIPGASLYRTMCTAFVGDVGGVADMAVYTLKLAAALALGVIVSSAAAKIFFPLYYKLKVKISKTK